MKVRIEFTVDIDPEAWAEEYGVTDAAKMRADVKAHARYMVLSHFRELGLSRG